MLAGKRILLVITGGIAAYKSLYLIRRLRQRGARVRCILSKGGAKFVTPLSVAALSHEKVYTDIFSLIDESEMGHLRLSQEADLIVVSSATADVLAKMALGVADELATTVLLAADAPILVAPAMNHRMWTHPATVANMAALEARGVMRIGPIEGELAEDESGIGRLAEPEDIVLAIDSYFGNDAPLSGRRALVTGGPTHEPIDPVRFLGNRSSGKQGYAIAAALARMGAETTLVSGPTNLPDPAGVSVVRIESAREMLAACEKALPVDVAVFAAAVADWRADNEAGQKIKKNGGKPPPLKLAENPDILATICAAGNRRPRLVVGFAAETEDVVRNATEKRKRKGCDWILANDVSEGSGTFGGDDNSIHLVNGNAAEEWPRMNKEEVAARLAERIRDHLKDAS